MYSIPCSFLPTEAEHSPLQGEGQTGVILHPDHAAPERGGKHGHLVVKVILLHPFFWFNSYELMLPYDDHGVLVCY